MAHHKISKMYRWCESKKLRWIIAFGDIGRTNARDLERYVLIFSHTNTFLLGFPPESWLANDDDGVV